MDREFESKVAEWRRDVDHVLFMGQIALDQEETDHGLNALGRKLRHSLVWESHALSLTVLAVNCAYHYYDEWGFWFHYCRKLGLEGTTGQQTRLGVVIEKYLHQQFVSFNKRSGPFRFVGGILEQCGVTRRFLPQFANLLLQFDRIVGWVGVQHLGHIEYTAHISDTYSKFLLQFLKDKAGWDLVTDVTRSLSQLQRGLLTPDQLCLLRGYRSGFWQQLLPLLRLAPPAYPPPQKIVHIPPCKPAGGVPVLSWDSKAKRPPFLAGEQAVFIGNAPRVRISHPHALVEGDYLLILDVGDGPRRIDPHHFEYTENGGAILDLDRCGVTLPCKGSLWLEVVGRVLRQDNLSPLTFAIVNEYSISLPEQLLRYDEPARVLLSGPAHYRLQLPGGLARQTDATGKVWEIRPGIQQIGGGLCTGRFDLALNLTIHRDILRCQDGSDLLVPEDIIAGRPVIVSGKPDDRLKLFLETPHGRECLLENGFLGTSGEMMLRPERFGAMLLDRQLPCGIISQCGGSHAGGLRYLNIDALLNLPAKEEPPDGPSFLTGFMGLRGGDVLQGLLLTLSGRNREPFDARSIGRMHRKLRSAAWAAALCAAVLDGLTIEGVGEADNPPVPRDVQKVLDWYREASSVHSDADLPAVNRLLQTFPDASLLPTSRWRKKIEHARVRLEEINWSGSDLTSAIIEWKEQVEGGVRINFKGFIANSPSGQALTTAWRNYLHRIASLQVVYSQARDLAGIRGVVGDLARLLLTLLLRKTERDNLLHNVGSMDVHPLLMPYMASLHGAMNSEQSFDNLMIPILEEDRNFFAGARGGPDGETHE